MIRSKIDRLHSRRSSKLILVVAGGVALIVLAFFALVILGGGGGRDGTMAQGLRYLKNTDGLAGITTLDAEKRAILVYNSASKNAGNFEQVAHYAAVRLARGWPDCDVLLARDSAERIVYRVRVRDGAIVAEGKP